MSEMPQKEEAGLFERVCFSQAGLTTAIVAAAAIIAFAMASFHPS